MVCGCDRVSLVLIRDPSFLSCILFEVVQLVHSRITRPGTKLLGRAKSVSLERLLLIGKTEWTVRAHLVNFHSFVEKCRILTVTLQKTAVPPDVQAESRFLCCETTHPINPFKASCFSELDNVEPMKRVMRPEPFLQGELSDLEFQFLVEDSAHGTA